MTTSKEVVSWKDALAADAAKTAKEERPSNSFISLKSGVMMYQEQMVPGNMIDCVIIAHAHERTFYDRPYNADDKAPPECFAQGLDGNDLTPHENVAEPMADKCKTCPMAEFGTARQGAGPACKTYRKLAIVPISALNAEGGVADAEMAVMRIPPTSVKNFSTYANKIASGSGLPPWAVATRILVKPHPKKQFEVTFEALEPVGSDEMLGQIHGRIEAAESVIMTPYDYTEEATEPAPDTSKQQGKMSRKK